MRACLCHPCVAGLAIVLGLALGSSLAAASTAASEPPPTPDDALLSTRRIPEQYADRRTIPASTTVITGATIAHLHAHTIEEVLAREAGVQWSDQQGFGLGSDGTLNLRGVVNSARTNALVLVDGVRQNRVTGDEVHWQSIPVDQIERIEIIRGSGGLMYGEGALSGVINIVTKRAGDHPVQAQASVDLGSFGWQRYHGSVQGRVAPLRYGMHYTRRLVTGYRESSMSRNTTISTHTGLDVAPGVKTDLHVSHSEDTTGFPGLLSSNEAEFRRRQTNPFHGVNTNEIDQVSLDLVAGPWEGMTGVLTTYWRRWIQQSEDSIQFNAFTVTPSRGLSLRTNSEWSHGSAKNLLVNGVELSEDKATTGDRDAFAGPDSESNRTGYGLYVEDTLTLWDRLSLIGGLRYDRFRFQESLTFPSFEGTLRFEGWSPRIGVSVVVIPDQLDLFTSYARPFKAPNVDDFSSRLGTSFSGNADLKPQQGDAYEVGGRLTEGPVTFDAAAFYSRIDDEILLNPLATPFQTNQNFDTRRFGTELSMRTKWSERVRSYATYTFIDAEFRKGAFKSETIPGTPEHTLTAGLGVSPLPGLWVDFDWRLVHDMVRINDVTNRLSGADNYGVLNLVCQYTLPKPARAQLWPDITAHLRVDNITNEEYATYESSNGTSLTGRGEAPMPPTGFFGGVSVSF